MGKIKDLMVSVDYIEINKNKLDEEFKSHVEALLETINRMMAVPKHLLEKTDYTNLYAQDHHEGEF